MSQQSKKFGLIWILGVLCCLFTAGNLLASERQGNLVFDAINKMEEVNKTFLEEVKKTRAKRAAAVARRDVVKERFRKAKPGSINQQEFQARFCLEEARMLSTLRDETDLTHQVAANHLKILNKLYRSIESGRGAATAQGIQAVLKATEPVLSGGKTLLASLAACSDQITDPMIHSMLNASVATAKMFSNYQANMKRGFTGSLASQEELKKQLCDMIQQLNAVFAQSDILGAMLRDKAGLLKTANELAGAKAFFSVLSGGKEIVSNLSESVMGNLIEAAGESDQDINLLIDGVLLDDRKETGNATRQRWLDGY